MITVSHCLSPETDFLLILTVSDSDRDKSFALSRRPKQTEVMIASFRYVSFGKYFELLKCLAIRLVESTRTDTSVRIENVTETILSIL